MAQRWAAGVCGLVVAGVALALWTPQAMGNDNPALGIGEPNTPFAPPMGPRGCGDIPCDGCDDNASPVFIGTGDLFKDFDDLTFGLRDLPFRIDRRYNSRDFFVGFFGRGYHSSLDIMSISTFKGASPEEVVVVRYANGQRARFTKQPDSTYTAPVGKLDVLTRTVDGFELVTPDDLVYTFDESTKLVSMADRNGNAITFAYDGAGRPTLATLPGGLEIVVSYGANGLVDSVADFAGRTVSYEYDASGYLTSFTDAGQNTWTYEYTGGRLSRIINPQAQTSLDVTYDAQGRVSRIIDEEGDFTYTYPSSTQSKKRDNATGGEWTYQYDSLGAITRITDPSGGITTRTYDGMQNLTSVNRYGETTSHTYDAEGHILSRTEPAGGGTTLFTYNSQGLVATTTDPLGVVTHFEYDANGNLTRRIDAFGDPLQRESMLTYDAQGNLTSSTDTLNNTEMYEYDAMGNRTKTTDALGHETLFAYDALGRLTSVTDPLSRVTSFEFDALGNLTRVVDPRGNAFVMQYDGANRLTTITDREQQPTTYEYDSQGRETRIVNALNQAFAFEYDSKGRVTRTVDPNNNAGTMAYNTSGFTISRTDALNQTTMYGVNAKGNRTSLTDARNQTTTFQYNFRNQLTNVGYPGGTTEVITYSVVGLPISKLDRNGQTTQFAYDKLGRLTLTTYPDASTVAFGYDAADHRTRVINAAADIEMTYDATGALLSETNHTLGTTVSYAYDEAGQLTAMTDPQAVVTTYSYDANGNLTGIVHPTMGAAGLTYDNENRLTDIDYASGASSSYGYDAAGRLTSVEHRRTDSSLVNSFAATLDPLGNALSLVDADGAHTYTYDAITQLLGATHPNPGVNPDESYSYDAVGNRLSSHLAASYAYDANNRLTQDSQFTYAYSNNGNLTMKTRTSDSQVTQYTYNALGQLASATDPGGVVTTFAYDGLERRASKTVDGVTTHYVYDGNQVLNEYDASVALQATYLNGPDTDQPLMVSRGGNIFRYCSDPSGSIATVLDSAEAAAKSYRYDSFGRIVDEAGTVANPFAYTGREWDEEIGLYYYRARTYDATIGRFLQPDPLGFAVAPNFYAYVSNNPVNWTDPLGLLGVPTYGNCCGPSVRCEPGGENCEMGPRDETDNCCNTHDRCLVGTGGATSCDGPSRQCHRELISCWANGPAANEGGFYRSNYRRGGRRLFQGILGYCNGRDGIDRARDAIDRARDRARDLIDGAREGLRRARDIGRGVNDLRRRWRDFTNPLPRLGF